MFTLHLKYICTFFSLIFSVRGVDNNIPRGLSPEASALFVPSKDFVCFDGLTKVPFTYVNDDYCDCEDGTDEPGTSACPNALFYCVNTGFVGEQIPSSRVNDGICDCCDGSDEYVLSNCHNYCAELNEAAMAKVEAISKIFMEGSHMRQSLILAAKQARLEKENQLKKLELDRIEAEEAKNNSEHRKILAVENETAALNIYKLKETEEDRREAHTVFVDLDINQNNIIDMEELQSQVIFDRNKDGIISNQELSWYLDIETEITEEVFFNSLWSIIKSISPEIQNEENLEFDQDDHIKQANDVGSEEEEKDDVTGFDEEQIPEIHGTPNEPIYDLNTMRLIDEANEARKQFESAEDVLRNIDSEIYKLKEKLEMDYGPNDEYFSLDGECYSFDDKEYIYKLCPFNQVTQTLKSDGSETKLGSWTGLAKNTAIPTMIFDGGQSCWNGPLRFTMVLMQCGLENSLVNVIEPNRCEYQMTFKTPAACEFYDDKDFTNHDEL